MMTHHGGHRVRCSVAIGVMTWWPFGASLGGPMGHRLVELRAVGTGGPKLQLFDKCSRVHFSTKCCALEEGRAQCLQGAFNGKLRTRRWTVLPASLAFVEWRGYRSRTEGGSRVRAGFLAYVVGQKTAPCF